MSLVVQVDHPLIQSHLTTLRNERTLPAEFRASLRRVSTLLAFEATRHLAVRDTAVQTPLTRITGKELGSSVALVPILRAGLGMVDPMLDLIPTAEVWHLGVYRDEATAEPVEYYNKIPDSHPAETAFVLDPMLATGGSAIVALSVLEAWKVRSIYLISIIAAQPGIDMVRSRFPDVRIIVGAIDPELNSRKFIVPGLGDAGDRTFGTLRHADV